jgi:Zn-dependent protease
MQALGAALFFLFLAFLVDWRFAAIIMPAIMVHELGHLFTAKAFGVRTLGVYFIPGLGAVAPMGAPPSRKAEFAIAIMGPAAGGLVAVALVALHLATGARIAAGLACLVALFNLFNLLPIHPMDGGRVAKSFFGSFSPKASIAVSGLGILAAIVAGFTWGFIFFFIAVLGWGEFQMELRQFRRKRDRKRILELLARVHGVPADAASVRAAVARFIFRIESAPEEQLWREIGSMRPGLADEVKAKGIDPRWFCRRAPTAAASAARVPFRGLLGGSERYATDERELLVDDRFADSSLAKYLSTEPPADQPPMTGPQLAFCAFGYVATAAYLYAIMAWTMPVMSPIETFTFFAR